MEEMPSPSPNSDEETQPSTQPDGGGTGGAGDTGVSIEDFRRFVVDLWSIIRLFRVDICRFAVHYIPTLSILVYR